MDVFAHGLWTNVLYKLVPQTNSDRKTTWWGIFFGIFPDIVAFSPGFLYILYRLIFLGQKFSFSRPEDSGNELPLDGLTHRLYNFSHSLVIWAAVLAVVWLIFLRFPWPLLGWALHVCIDIFSHNSKFFPTPFLWPISNFHIEGKSWGDPVFMIVNYSALLIIYLFLVPYLKRITKNKKHLIGDFGQDI